MQNPMLNQLNQSRMMPIKNMFNMVKAAKNPQMMLNQMMSQNPQFNQVMNYINSNGGDPKTAFYNMAKEKGVDPEQILSQLR